MVSLTLISSWIMVSISIRKPVKIAAGISPIEAVRFTPVQKDIRSRKRISSSILFQWELRILSVTAKDNLYYSVFEFGRNYPACGILHGFAALPRGTCKADLSVW